MAEMARPNWELEDLLFARTPELLTALADECQRLRLENEALTLAHIRDVLNDDDHD